MEVNHLTSWFLNFQLSERHICARSRKPGQFLHQTSQIMSYRRENRGSRAAHVDRYDNIEEGGLGHLCRTRVTLLSMKMTDLDSLKDRVFFLKQGNDMDASRGILSGTVDRFKMVFEKKSGHGMCKLVGFLVVFFLLFFYLIRILSYFK